MTSADPIADAAADLDLESADADEDGVVDLESSPDPTPSGLTDRLMQPLEGSIQQDHVGELWDPENGGPNRLVLVAEEAAGLSDGLPRLAHLLLGLAETYVAHADQLTLGSSPDPDEEPELTISPEELE